MEKINLSVQRSFSDLITVTINFMKQEFVPFIWAFAVIDVTNFVHVAVWGADDAVGAIVCYFLFAGLLGSLSSGD